MGKDIIINGLICLAFSVLMCSLITNFVVGMPADPTTNVINNAVSGGISGFISGLATTIVMWKTHHIKEKEAQGQQ